MLLRRNISFSSARAAAFVLLAASTVLAHDHAPVSAGPDAMDMGMHSHSHSISTPSNSSNSLAFEPPEPSYFRHEDYHWILLTHVILMSISWIFVLPVSIMLTISRSKWRLPLQFSFLVLNAVGVFASILYNANTPNLYKGNVHHSLGWVVTWIVGVQMILALLNAYAASGEEVKGEGEEYRPLNAGEMQSGHWDAGHENYAKPEHRYSDDSAQGSSLRSSSSSSLTQMNSEESTLHDVELSTATEPSKFRSKYIPGAFWAKFDDKVSALSGRSLHILSCSEKAIVRLIMPLGYVTFLSGIAAYGGLFHGHEIFSGLAHWIKGSICFWYGLLTLGRWAGCFADRGWAWNVLPVQAEGKRYSAELVESALIFFYGVTNVFLEHLSAWGKEWSMMLLQHLGITILFTGGGLCGMLVESNKVRNLLNTSSELQVSEKLSSQTVYSKLGKLSTDDEEEASPLPPVSYRFSINPLPALTIILLGLLMSSHHQSSMVSTMIHAQWANLLMFGALARGATYLLYFIKPPTSMLPGRPPTEVVAAFCFIAGGVMFMVSARDSVQALEANGLDAMFAFTIVCGVVAALMAWELVVLSIKGWAVSKRLGA